MTILDSTMLLFEWFSKHDNFNVTDDGKCFKEILQEKDCPDSRVAILLGLEGLVKQEFLQEKTIKDTRYFILVKPLESFEQTVQLKASTAKVVAQLLNRYAEASGNKEVMTKPTEINEQSVLNLVGIILSLSQSQKEDKGSAPNFFDGKE